MNQPADTYERLWLEAVAALRHGDPQIDLNLPRRATDLRRGVSLALHPSPEVRAGIKAFLDRLATIVPGQHIYQPEELHVTVLSIISGSENWRQEIRHLSAFRALIANVMKRQRAFKIRFQGVTASPGSVMIQGLPEDETLEQIRDELRAVFARNGWGRQLDRRYKISTAHITVMRFCQRNADWQRLLALLEENRCMDFGETDVHQIQLLWGDWYATTDIVRTLEEYALASPKPET